MEPDVNHARPHVHIDEHGASFDVKTGELMDGKCDARTMLYCQKGTKKEV